MAKVFDVLIERDADGRYLATVPALLGCHTQAKPLDALISGCVKQLRFVWKWKSAVQARN